MPSPLDFCAKVGFLGLVIGYLLGIGGIILGRDGALLSVVTAFGGLVGAVIGFYIKKKEA